MDKIDYLSQINLFNELSMKELKIIDSISTMHPIQKGTIILSPNKPSETLFLLKKGNIRLYKMDQNGNELTVDLLGGGNIFGETNSLTLTNDEIYAKAMNEVYICTINKKQFTSLLEKKPKLGVKFIDILSTKLKEMYETGQEIALDNVKDRIIALLIKLSSKFGQEDDEWKTINVKITHQDIATMIGSTRETVSILMGELKKEGIVKKQFTYLKINIKKIKE
ncbi:Crp/Fnr family transcriptional regulator [Staphylococcus borealis]|nr:Crp/Fnr family transcriptional regulator [Staphylococcus borealis]